MSDFSRRLWQRLLRSLGVSGLIGIALLLLATALATWTPRLRQQAALVHETAQARQLAITQQRAQSAQVPPLRQQLDLFALGFPQLSQNAGDLEKLFAVARQHRVELPKGEYKFSTEPNSPFVTYSATFPIKQGYGRIKEFAADVLRDLPHAAMDELRLERSDAGATTLDARIRITLTYRAS
jgi:type II secretory pathway pseudopilin PulG